MRLSTNSSSQLHVLWANCQTHQR